MSLPTEFSVKMVSDLFFRRFKELSIRSLKELKDGNRRPELRLVHVSSELRPLKNVSQVGSGRPGPIGATIWVPGALL